MSALPSNKPVSLDIEFVFVRRRVLLIKQAVAEQLAEIEL